MRHGFGRWSPSRRRSWWPGAGAARSADTRLQGGTVAECITALKSDDAELRRAAAARLGKIPQGMKARRVPDAVAALIDALKDTDPAVRAKAVGTLARIDRDGKTAFPAVVGRLDDPAASVRTAAVMGLGRHLATRVDVRRPVLLALKDADAGVRLAAVDAVGAVGLGREGVLPAVTGLLRDPDALVQRAAARTLGYGWGSIARESAEAREAVALLFELARDKTHPGRAAVLEAIGQIGPDAGTAVPILTEALADPAARAAAAGALVRYGALAYPAVPTLRGVAKGDAGRAVVVALLRLDPDADETWAAYRDLPAKDRPGVVHAPLTLDREGKEKATVTALTNLLKDPDAKARESAVYSALLFGRRSPAVRTATMPPLLELLKTGGAPAHDGAEALALMKGEAKAAVPDILKALEREKDYDTREMLLYSLKQIDPEGAKKVGKP